MSGAAQTLRQVRFTNKAFWRNPASAFFTFAFPLLFLVIFTTLLGEGKQQFGGVTIENTTYYVAAMAGFSVISACYTNIAISICFTRDAGILKRTRGTPLPSWAYLTGRVVHAIVVAGILVAITVAFGSIFYEADIPTGETLFRFLVTLLVGAGCFAALGLAVSAAIPNADAGPPIVNAIMLPLLFLSGAFFLVGDDAPAWVRFIGDVFPVRPFLEAMRASFVGPPLPFSWTDVLVVAVWGLAGVVVAARFFSWEPRR